MKSPRQPTSSAERTGRSAAAAAPPSSPDCAGRRRRRSRSRRSCGKCSRARAMEAAVKAVSVAAPSAGETFHRRHAEIHTVQRFRRRHARKSDCPASRPARFSSTVPARASVPSSSYRLAGVAMHPIVDRRIAGTGIEGQHLIVGADIGDIGHAADIDHHQRPAPALRASAAMIERHEGRALPARRDIGAAEIVDHIDAGQPRQLPRRRRSARSSARSRPVQDRSGRESRSATSRGLELRPLPAAP